MAGTGSHKPYLFNADNVPRDAPVSWHRPGRVIDSSHEALNRRARGRGGRVQGEQRVPFDSLVLTEPRLTTAPPGNPGLAAADAAAAAGRGLNSAADLLAVNGRPAS